jgi:anti-sigma regulatory factor (Ser/Thr protein kinase)
MSFKVGKLALGRRPMHQKTFLAHLNQLYEMLNFIQSYGSLHHIDACVLNQIVVAAEEVLVNIIHYGYPHQPGNIEIICEEAVEKPGVHILIKDQGVPFNPVEKAFTNKKNETANLKVGGYGIYLYVEMMDQVEYKRDKAENILSLVKYI